MHADSPCSGGTARARAVRTTPLMPPMFWGGYHSNLVYASHLADWLGRIHYPRGPMSKNVARLLIAAVVLFTAANWLYARKTKAAPPQMFQAQCRSFVPLEWGDFKGSSSGFGLAFQDSTGTIRFVTNATC